MMNCLTCRRCDSCKTYNVLKTILDPKEIKGVLRVEMMSCADYESKFCIERLKSKIAKRKLLRRTKEYTFNFYYNGEHYDNRH